MPEQKQHWPEWLKPAIDERFYRLALVASRQNQSEELHDKQAEILRKLRLELTESQLRMVLEWNDIMNYRNAIEKEWMYHAGIEDGIQMSRMYPS